MDPRTQNSTMENLRARTEAVRGRPGSNTSPQEFREEKVEEQEEGSGGRELPRAEQRHMHPTEKLTE